MQFWVHCVADGPARGTEADEDVHVGCEDKYQYQIIEQRQYESTML